MPQRLLICAAISGRTIPDRGGKGQGFKGPFFEDVSTKTASFVFHIFCACSALHPPQEFLCNDAKEPQDISTFLCTISLKYWKTPSELHFVQARAEITPVFHNVCAPSTCYPGDMQTFGEYWLESLAVLSSLCTVLLVLPTTGTGLNQNTSRYDSAGQALMCCAQLHDKTN